MRLSEFAKKQNISESVQTVPLTDAQFEELKERLMRPIPAEIAATMLHDVLETSELTEEYNAVASTHPNEDVRPVVAKWLELNMPDQMYRFTGQQDDPMLKFGLLSPLHGYNPNDIH